VPNALCILVNLAHAMKWHAVDLTFGTHQFKRRGALLRKRQLLQRDRDDPVLRSIVIAQLEVPFGELGIPPNAVEQFVNRSHVKDGLLGKGSKVFPFIEIWYARRDSNAGPSA